MAASDAESALEPLVALVARVADDGRRTGRFAPQTTLVFRTRATALTFTPDGTANAGLTSAQEPEPDWGNSIAAIIRDVKETDEYKKALSAGKPQESPGDLLLQPLIHRVALGVLTESPIDQRLLCSNMARELDGQPLPCRAIVHLAGIRTGGAPVEFSSDDVVYRVRRPEFIDFDRREHWPTSAFPPTYSCVMTIDMRVSSPREAQEAVLRTVDALRLSCVGSVAAVEYTFEGDALLNPLLNGRMSSARVAEKYVSRIDANHVKRMPLLFGRIMPKLRTELAPYQTPTTAPAIAFGRYNAALLRADTFEESTATTVMGLESLFLKGSEHAELTFRLKMRIARIIRRLGGDPPAVSALISDAYAIRSLHVHGDAPTAKDISKIEQRYGGQSQFLRLLLDVLRQAIVLFVLSDATKDFFLPLVDDALIDDRASERLDEWLVPYADLVGPSKA